MSSIKGHYKYSLMYIGQDKDYWQTIKTVFTEKYDTIEVKFTALESDKRLDHLLDDVARVRPNIIFIDYPHDGEKIHKLSKVINNDISSKTKVVAVLPNN